MPRRHRHTTIIHVFEHPPPPTRATKSGRAVLFSFEAAKLIAGGGGAVEAGAAVIC